MDGYGSIGRGSTLALFMTLLSLFYTIGEKSAYGVPGHLPSPSSGYVYIGGCPPFLDQGTNSPLWPRYNGEIL
jgi:hypothetical protein